MYSGCIVTEVLLPLRTLRVCCFAWRTDRPATRPSRPVFAVCVDGPNMCAVFLVDVPSRWVSALGVKMLNVWQLLLFHSALRGDRHDGDAIAMAPVHGRAIATYNHTPGQ